MIYRTDLWSFLMDKAELIREITNRIVGMDIDKMKLTQSKASWYNVFMRVSTILNHVEELSKSELVTFKYKEDGEA